jgi:hypothetical protein
MTEPRWIPLSERKPVKRGYYYFYNPKAWHEDNMFETHWFCGYSRSVTHWLELELPEPPKEEKPVDPDWEKVEEMMGLWRKAQCDNDDAIAAIYRFLKAKYGN